MTRGIRCCRARLAAEALELAVHDGLEARFDVAVEAVEIPYAVGIVAAVSALPGLELGVAADAVVKVEARILVGTGEVGHGVGSSAPVVGIEPRALIEVLEMTAATDAGNAIAVFCTTRHLRAGRAEEEGVVEEAVEDDVASPAAVATSHQSAALADGLHLNADVRALNQRVHGSGGALFCSRRLRSIELGEAQRAVAFEGVKCQLELIVDAVLGKGCV